ncbi:MAG: hypothetical protein MZV64_70045 [Ignavibacteriales bacterium]|nr:hypothetical protein [Ignavibacteriales bacterium]
MYRPTKIFFTKGVGRSKEYLTSFELSLRSARIEMCNLVSVSSIFPGKLPQSYNRRGFKRN